MLKVGVQTLPWYDETDPQGSLEFIKSMGFDAIDLGIDHYLPAKEFAKEGISPTLYDKSVEEIYEYFAPLKRATETTGISVCQIHAPFPVWFEGKDEVNDYIFMALDKCFAIAEYLGCPAVVVHASNLASGDREAEWEVNLGIYRRLIPVIKKYKGVKICTENIFNRRDGRMIEGRFSNASDCCRLIDMLNAEAGGDYFGLCFDIGHANLTGRNVKEFVKEVGSRLTILHLHDNDGKDDLHMLPYSYLSNPRSHVCDWQGFLEGLRDINYRGVICFETYRVLNFFPKEVHNEALRLISAIGHYWADFVENK